MARIRSIKPEFPQSETVGRLSRDARLLFIQLWTVVDDEGRTRAASRMLASLLYPYDDDAPTLIEGWLAELEDGNCIRRYEVDGSTYLDIPNWLKHQKIDKPSKSRLPPFSEHSAKPRDLSRSLAPDLGPRTLDQDLGSTSLRSVVSETSSDAHPPKRKQTYSEAFETFWREYPTDPNMSKKEAFDAWKRLTDEDHEAAIASLPSFKTFCSKDPTYRPIHANRFLTKRRFEGHLGTNGSASTTGPPPELTGAERAAWIRRRMAEQENGADVGSKGGGVLGQSEAVCRERHDRPSEPTLV